MGISMHEGALNKEELGTWDPESGVPPPMTPEYGIDAPAANSLEWDPNGTIPPPIEEASVWPGKEQGLPPPLTSESEYPQQEILIQDSETKIGPLAQELSALEEGFAKARFSEEQQSDDRAIEREMERVMNIMAAREILTDLAQEDGERSLTKEEREKLLSPEVLSSLSTEEYIDLWKHLSPHYVSHVTRQGYRENYFTYHSKGLGEFHNGFGEILADEKGLRSPMGLEGVENTQDIKKEIKDFLEQKDFSLPERDDLGREHYPNPWKKIKQRLTASLGSAPKIADETAVHLASDRVLDNMYGGETDNQVFMIYPSDMVASQYHFAFNRGDLSFNDPLPESEQKWNDVFVWDKEDPMKTHLPLDAGIVFLPRSTRVDPKTGSKYSSYKRTESETGEETFETELPTESITSEEYWNSYFGEHSELKPKHVVYYDGDPTKAMQEFLKEHGITGKDDATHDDGALGFKENHVEDMRRDPRTLGVEQEMFRQGALALIDHFNTHPSVSPDELLGSDDLDEIRELLGTLPSHSKE